MKIRSVVMVMCTALFFTTPMSAIAEKSINPEDLAQCLVEKGALFFGTYWCPYCDKQKKLFGEAAKSLPYVECDRRGENPQIKRCKDNRIHYLPTWVFPDSTRVFGAHSLESLKEKSGC